MKSFILVIEKIVMGVMNIARIFKFKWGDKNEEAIMTLIDDTFEKLLGE